MPLATAIISLLLATLLTFSAVQKFSHRPDIVAGYARVGVPEERLNALALVLLSSAAGLVSGLFWSPIGIAASTLLACYFLVAIAAHVRADDRAGLPIPIAIELLAVGALALQAGTP